MVVTLGVVAGPVKTLIGHNAKFVGSQDIWPGNAITGLIKTL